jgi:putative heme-binding domain-containing protein
MDTKRTSAICRELMKYKEDNKDPVIPQLVWIAYEKSLTKRPANPERKRGGDEPVGADRSPVEEELAWLAEQAPDNIFVRDHIVPKVMRRLVATGKPEDLKLCIDFVAKLNDVNSREKALGGLAQALDKQQVDAPEGWAALNLAILKDNNPRLVSLANKLAVSFRDPAAIKRAFDAVANVKLPVEARAEGVRQLATLQPPEATPVLLKLLGQDASDAVRAEAARSLAAFDRKEIPTTLINGWKDYPQTVRPEVINTLSARKEWAKALLQAMADKKIDRAEVTDNSIIRIQAFNDKELNTLIEKAWGRTRATPKELNELIDKTRASLHEAPASFQRGRKVFENNCAKCHKFDGKGAEVGPPLEGAGRDIEYILMNVLDPNRVIGAPYFVRTVRTLDDVVFQGLLSEEDDNSITLKLEGASFKTIRKANIAEIRVAEKSLMPEGLGYNMTAQDFRDLVRYLMAHPFITDARVNGTQTSVGAPGRFLLPDTKGAPVVIEADVMTATNVKTKLLVGSSADYEVRLNGKAIGTGKGTGKQLRPDQDSFDVTLPAGKHTLSIVARGGAGNGLHARFLDPDRKLSYPDVSESK